jgi:hypothetical protein
MALALAVEEKLEFRITITAIRTAMIVSMLHE